MEGYSKNRYQKYQDIVGKTTDGYIGKLCRDLKKEVNKYLEEKYKFTGDLEELLGILITEECLIKINNKYFKMDRYKWWQTKSNKYGLEIHFTNGSSMYLDKTRIGYIYLDHGIRESINTIDIYFKGEKVRVMKRIGYWIDEKFNKYPILTPIIGLIIAMVIFFKYIIKMMDYNVKYYEAK